MSEATQINRPQLKEYHDINHLDLSNAIDIPISWSDSDSEVQFTWKDDDNSVVCNSSCVLKEVNESCISIDGI